MLSRVYVLFNVPFLIFSCCNSIEMTEIEYKGVDEWCHFLMELSCNICDLCTMYCNCKWKIVLKCMKYIILSLSLVSPALWVPVEGQLLWERLFLLLFSLTMFCILGGDSPASDFLRCIN